MRDADPKTATAVIDTVSAVPGSAWLFSHLVPVNQILQTALLLTGIVSGGFAIYWHLRRFRDRQ